MSHANAVELASQISLIVKQTCREEINTAIRAEFSRFKEYLNALESPATAPECAISPRGAMVEGDSHSTISSHAVNENAPRRKSSSAWRFRSAQHPSFSVDSDHYAPGCSAAGATGFPRPMGESSASFASRFMASKTVVKPMGVYTFLDAPDCEDPVLDEGINEAEMWRCLKASGFYRNIWACMTYFDPLPLRDWVRTLVLVPRTLQLVDLQRMCDEEDMSTLCVSLVKPATSGNWGMLKLLFWAVIHPSCIMRTQWDLYVLAVLFSVCIITPFVICFDINVMPVSVLGVWEVTVDATFMIDMYLNFRTAFICSNGGDVLITSRSAIAKRYVVGFFPVDVLSTLPWDILLQNGGLGLVQLFKASKFMRLSRAIRILKIVRILRLLKAPMIMKRLEQTLGRSYVRIGAAVSLILFILHVFACVFHYVAIVASSGSTWIQASGIVNSESIWDRYVTSVYWAMSTMTTVGYGDVTPIQTMEKLIAMAGMFVGVTAFAYVTGSASLLLSTLNAQAMRTQEQQRQLDSFCRTHKIPKALGAKLEHYFDHVLRRRIHTEDLELVRQLSGTLRQQVLLTMHANLLDRLPFLNNKHPQFLEQLIPQLKLEYYSSGEYVIWQGDHSSDMYFVCEGLLEVRVTVDNPATTTTTTTRCKKRRSSGQGRGLRMSRARDPHGGRKRSPGISLERKAQALWRQHDVFKWHRASAMNRSHEHANVTLRERSVAAMMRPLHLLRGIIPAASSGRVGVGIPSSGPHSSAVHPAAQDELSTQATGSSRVAGDGSAEHLELHSEFKQAVRQDPSNPCRGDHGWGARESSAEEVGRPEMCVSRGAAVRGSEFLSVVAAAAQKAQDRGDGSATSTAQCDGAGSPVRVCADVEDVTPASGTTGAEAASAEVDARGIRAEAGAEGPAPPPRHGALQGPAAMAEAAEGSPAIPPGSTSGLDSFCSDMDTDTDAEDSMEFLMDCEERARSSGIVDRMIGIQAAPFRRVGKLEHGEYFGEIACWTGAARSASIVTITTCELYCLQRTSLLALAREWPDIARELKFTSDTAPDTMPTAEIAAAAAAAGDFSDRRTQSIQAARLSKKWQSIAKFSRASGSGEKSSILSLIKPVATNRAPDTAAPAVVHADGRPHSSSDKEGDHVKAEVAGDMLSASGPPRPPTAPQPILYSGLAGEAAGAAEPTQMVSSWAVQPGGSGRTGTESRRVSFSPGVACASAAKALNDCHSQHAPVAATAAEGCPQMHPGRVGSGLCLPGATPEIASGSPPSNPRAGTAEAGRPRQQVHEVDTDGVVDTTNVDPLGE